MYKIGLDLGYNYTKGVNQSKKRILFPSLVGSSYKRNLANLFESGTNRKIENMHISITDGKKTSEYFVGDLARRESPNASFAFDEDKINHPNTIALLAASSMLLMPEDDVSVHLVTGLPLEQYVHKKDEFKKMLDCYKFAVNFIGEDKVKVIKYDKVTIFPQAAGAVYHAIMDNLHKYLIKGSYIGLIDIGFRTIDVIVFMIEDRLILREDLSLTLDFGMSSLNVTAEKLFTEKTGSKLDLTELMRLVSDSRIFFRGREWIFEEQLNSTKAELAKVIKDRIKGVWQTKLDFFNTVFLAGGGAKSLYEFMKDIHGNTILVKDPQFANANGFLKVAELINGKEGVA